MELRTSSHFLPSSKSAKDPIPVNTQVYYRLGYGQVCAATIQEPQITSKYSKLRAKRSRCKEAAEGSNIEDEMKISIDKKSSVIPT